MAQEYHKLLNDPEIISWAKKYLKRSDRIFWYLKKVKEYPAIHPSEELKHFFAMDIPKINSYQLIHQEYYAVCMQFRRYETQYNMKNQGDNSLIEIEFEKEKQEILLKLPGNWYWVKLNTSFCKKEARAMGHCGNQGGKDNDCLLSLRKKVSKGNHWFWQPHLTFVLSAEGSLGEMKGRTNSKPQARYHQQILELLRLPLINKIEGGGYLPEKNFKVLDLDEENLEVIQNELIEKVDFSTQFIIENRKSIESFIAAETQSLFLKKDLIEYLKSDQEKLLFLGVNAEEELALMALAEITDLNYQIKAAETLEDPKRLSRVGENYIFQEEVREPSLQMKLYNLGLIKKVDELRYLAIQGVKDISMIVEILKAEILSKDFADYILAELLVKVSLQDFWEIYQRVTDNDFLKKKTILPFLKQEQVLEVLMKDTLEVQCEAIQQVRGIDLYLRLIDDEKIPTEVKEKGLKLLTQDDFLSALMVGTRSHRGRWQLQELESALKLFSHPEVEIILGITKCEEIKHFFNALKECIGFERLVGPSLFFDRS